jgi:hypothetical protein
MKVEKLINDYLAKIKECDADIEASTERMDSARKEASEWFYNGAKEYRKLAQVQRQLYVQVVKDLEDLL